MIRYIKEGSLRGFGILKLGNREVINITGSYDSTQFGLGINIDCSKYQPIHIGFTLGRLTVYIQLFGVQF